MNQVLIDYVQKERFRGISDDQILQNLLVSGWSPDKIKEGLENSPQLTVLPPTTSVQPKHKIPILGQILIFICILMFWTGISLAGYYYYRAHQSSISPSSTKDITQTTSTPMQEQKTNSILVYVATSQVDSKNMFATVKFFDYATQKTLPEFNELATLQNPIFSLGHWSPDGRYLPIVALTNTEPLRGGKSESFVFLYDSKNSTINKIFSSNNSPYTNLISTNLPSFYITQRWLSNEQMVVSGVPNGTAQKTLTLLSISGMATTKIVDANFILNNDEMTITHAPQKNLSDISTINFLQIRNKIYTVRPKGTIIGIQGNTLISLEQPRGLSLMVGDFDNTASQSDMARFNELSTEWQKAGLSEEAIATKTFDFIKPIQDHILYFTDFDTGTVIKQIALPSDEWITSTAQVAPLTGDVIIRQEERIAGYPTKERYLKVDPKASPGYTVLFEQPVDKIAQEYTKSTQMYYSSDFFVTTDGKWIAEYKGNTEKSTDIFLKNIQNGQEVSVCSVCREIRLYNPRVLKVL